MTPETVSHPDPSQSRNQINMCDVINIPIGSKPNETSITHSQFFVKSNSKDPKDP